MKRRTWIMLLVVTASVLVASAQTNPFKNRKKPDPATKQKPKIDFSVEPSVAPTEELNVSELLLQRKEMEGKVVELEFDRVIDLKQSDNGYTARVTFERGRISEGVILLIPEEGLELFEEMAKRDFHSPLRKKVYIEVLGGSVCRAVGVRYSKKKDEGERYSW